MNPFPLQWPQGFPRTKNREQGQFRVNFDAALKNVRKSLDLFGKSSGRKVENPVLTSNINYNPLAEKVPLDDPGVAVWFLWDGTQVCIPVDRYTTPAANLQAVHMIIESRRTELRHGTLQLVKATFTGLRFLPAPEGEHWRDVLGITDANPTAAQITAAWKERAKAQHPDKPEGSSDHMARLNNAKDAALREIGR